MAAGDLTLTVSLSGTLSGGDAIRTFSESKVSSSIADYFDRIIQVPTSLITVLEVGATVAGATLSTLRGLIVYNMDATNYVRLGFLAANGASYIDILAGEIYVTPSDQLEAFSAATAFSAFETITTVNLIANSAAVRCQVVAW